MKSFENITVELPGRTYPNASLRYTSELGFGGCQGVVVPAVLKLDGQERLVQVKTFYRQSVDDRGDSFSQNPEDEVERSYRALCTLRDRGFKVPDFFAKTRLGDQPALVLDDLRKGETVEVFDEKHFHRDRAVINVLDGKETECKARKAVCNLKNYADIQLGFLHTHLLSAAYGASFGFGGGVEHMITRDPRTNTGDIFVVDVGEYGEGKSKYKDKVSLDDLLVVPEDEINSVCAELMQRHHPAADATRMLERFESHEARRKKFMDLVYKATIGLALWENIGGMMQNEEWARQRFVKNGFSELFLKVKLYFDFDCDRYKHITGEQLFRVGQQDHDRFVGASRWRSRSLGIDFAYLAVLDARVQHLMLVREAIDAGKPLPTASPVAFADDGFPKLGFFDNYNETKGPTTIVTVKRESWNEEKVELLVELPWRDAYDVVTRYNFVPPFLPQQIKGVTVDDLPLEGFDPRNVEVDDNRITLNYYYRNNGHLIELCRLLRDREEEDKKACERVIRELRKQKKLAVK